MTAAPLFSRHGKMANSSKLKLSWARHQIHVVGTSALTIDVNNNVTIINLKQKSVLLFQYFIILQHNYIPGS